MAPEKPSAQLTELVEFRAAPSKGKEVWTGHVEGGPTQGLAMAPRRGYMGRLLAYTRKGGTIWSGATYGK